MNDAFRKFAQKTSELTGSSWAFITAATVIVIDEFQRLHEQHALEAN